MDLRKRPLISFAKLSLAKNLKTKKKKSTESLFSIPYLPNPSASFILGLSFNRPEFNKRTVGSFTQQGSTCHLWALKWKLSLGRLLYSFIQKQQGFSLWLWIWVKEARPQEGIGMGSFSLGRVLCWWRTETKGNRNAVLQLVWSDTIFDFIDCRH